MRGRKYRDRDKIMKIFIIKRILVKQMNELIHKQDRRS